MISQKIDAVSDDVSDKCEGERNVKRKDAVSRERRDVVVSDLY